MSCRVLFKSVHEHPEMYGLDRSYSAASAFVSGYDLGNEGGLLVGFREWLAVKAKAGSNLSWHGLVILLTYPGGSLDPNSWKPDQAKNSALFDSLFVLLDEFWDIRETGSLAGVFVKYRETFEQLDH